MQVFKVYFKVVQKNIGQMIIYVGLFFFFAVVLTNVYSTPQNSSFSVTKCNIAFINNDTNSKLVRGSRDYLSENANIVNIADNTQKLQDALFFGSVDYIVRVPKGFTAEFLSGKDVQLQKTTIPDSANSFYMDSMIDNYMNTAKTYSDNIKNLSQADIVSYVDNDLSQTTQVDLSNFKEQNSNAASCAYYFNFLAYALFAVLILGVCVVMMVFTNSDLKKRNLCSPIKLKNMNMQMVLGNISFALISWFLLIIASFIMYGSYMFTANALLLLLNSLVFTLAALSVSYLIGNLLKSRGAMQAAANVIALGSSFICGVFVPQYLLSKTVINIANFLPTYWYVKNNNNIVNIVNFNMQNLMPVFINMFIVLGFAAAILIVTLVVIKQRRMSS